MKKLIITVFIAVFLISIAPVNPAGAIDIIIPPEPEDIYEAIVQANAELGLNYFDVKSISELDINPDIWDMRRCIVYGESWDLHPSGYHRYLGKTMDDNDYTNVFHPHDAWAGGYIEDRNWIKRPWLDDDIEQQYDLKHNVFNNNDWNLNIIYGMYLYYGPSGALRGDFTNWDWHEYVHILQPPTYFSWGMGRMWHRTGAGQTWYMTVPIMPEYELLLLLKNQPDFYTTISINTDKTEPGKSYSGTVTYGLKDTTDFDASADIKLVHNFREQDWPITSIPAEITLQPGEEVSYQFAFTGQDRARSILISEIWPQEGTDPHPADNKAIAEAMPVSPAVQPPAAHNPAGGSINLDCLDVAYTRGNRIPYAAKESKDRESWQTTYTWLADIERGCTPWSYDWTDEDGNTHTESGCDPWEREIWESKTVTYSESLEMQVEIDSWQATEGKGRGAWQIIPLFGSEASRTVRAGTGFEVNVITRYTTDWETKVPVEYDYYGNPVAFGGTYSGPERVFVCFPYANHVKSVDPNNNRDFVMGKIGMGYGERVELEKVEVIKQTPQETVIRWQLPMREDVAVSGTVYRNRIHVIDKFFPNTYPASYDQKIQDYMWRNNAEVDTKINFDDRYRFYVAAEGAGKHGLYSIKEDWVFVFGHVFNDIWQTKPKGF